MKKSCNLKISFHGAWIFFFFFCSRTTPLILYSGFLLLRWTDSGVNFQGSWYAPKTQNLIYKQGWRKFPQRKMWMLHIPRRNIIKEVMCVLTSDRFNSRGSSQCNHNSHDCMHTYMLHHQFSFIPRVWQHCTFTWGNWSTFMLKCSSKQQRETNMKLHLAAIPFMTLHHGYHYS